ncbi:MAG: adenylate kinase [Actinomycetota bacterium]|nr:adenylate kinase [Actinomycetota bacterium]
MPLDVVILGPPGAGKGTQGKRISAELGIPHVNTGEMYRAAVAAGSELGGRVKPIMDAGDLVPDDLTIDVVRERLTEADTREGFVLDGFPRTLRQARALDEILGESERELTLVLDFQLPEELAEQRLLKRALEQGREDDTPEVIHRRMQTMSVPDELIAYYRAKGILVGIHADRTIDEVFAEVQSVLGAAAAR